MIKYFTVFLACLFLYATCFAQGFKVVGSELHDANNNNFIMKGINVPTAWFAAEVNSNITNIKNKTGANCLRIVVTTTSPDNQWQTSVQNCIANKMIPMVELHNVTGNNNAADLQQMATFWASKASFFNKPEIARYILINIANEWGDWYMSATATGAVSRVTWRDAYINAVKTLRNANINTTIVVDAPGYGQDNKTQTLLAYANAVQQADPLHNILFSIHMYCEWRVGGNSTISTHLPAVKAAGIPVIVGEFGYQHSEGSSICDINETQILNVCQSSGIGWLAWSWKGNGSPVEYLDLSTDWAGNNLSAWGNTVVNGANGTKTAIPASVFTITGNEAQEVETGFEIYHNPGADNIQISFPSNMVETGNLIICDNLGNTIYSQAICTSKSAVSLADLSAGLYIGKVSNGKISYSKKFIKN